MATGRNKRRLRTGRNGWDALTEIMIAALGKGQFVAAIAGAIVLTIIVKMRPDDVHALALVLLDKLERRYILGYGLFLLTLFGWFYHAKWTRRIAELELRRVAGERTNWQEKVLNTQLESSRQ